MPKVVNREEMQDRILDAAITAFSQRGYHAATVADVAGAAGLGKGTLYLYFKNKEAIAEAMGERYFARMRARFMATAVPDDVNAFIGSLEEAMNVPDDHAKLIRVFFEVFGPSFASERFAGSVSAFFEDLGDHYAYALAHLQEQGAIRSDLDPKLLARSLASIVDGMILHRGLFGITEQRYANMRRETLAVILRGLVAA